jgi:hypothetical protein
LGKGIRGFAVALAPVESSRRRVLATCIINSSRLLPFLLLPVTDAFPVESHPRAWGNEPRHKRVAFFSSLARMAGGGSISSRTRTASDPPPRAWAKSGSRRCAPSEVSPLSCAAWGDRERMMLARSDRTEIVAARINGQSAVPISWPETKKIRRSLLWSVRVFGVSFKARKWKPAVPDAVGLAMRGIAAGESPVAFSTVRQPGRCSCLGLPQLVKVGCLSWPCERRSCQLPPKPSRCGMTGRDWHW